MQRAKELRQEAECFVRAAAFLQLSAERKLRLAAEIERIDGTRGRAGGVTAVPPLRLAGQPSRGDE